MPNRGYGLTAHQKEILKLSSLGLTDYKIARKLKTEPPNITRSRTDALRKIETERGDIAWFDDLKPKTRRY